MSATREDAVRPPAASTAAVLQAPSATWTRFVLFGATLLFAAIPFYHWLLEIAFRWTPDVGDCSRRTASATDPGAYASALAGCPTETFRSAMLLDLAPLVALLALAGIRYLRHPARIRRRRHLVPLAQSTVLPADHRLAVEAELARLADESEVRGLPVFLTHDDDRGSASTFGLPPRHEMRLDAGLLMRAKSDDEVDRQHFRGTVRHELAHLRNRDIGIIQLTDALRWAFLVLTAGPVLAVAVFDLTRDTAWAEFVAGEVRGLAAVVVLVLLAHRSVRRAREHYADLRAALVDGGVWFARSVARAAEEEQEETRRLHGRAARLRHWYDRAVDRHPSPTRRVEVFGDPTVLLRFHLGEAAVAGTAAGLGYQGVHLAISRLLGTWPWAPVLVGIILALPVAAVLAAGALREACAGPARRRFVLARALAAGLVTVAGLLLGESLSWSALVVRWWPATLTEPGTGLVVAGVLAAGVVLVVGWLVVSADLAVSNGALRRPRLLLAAATGAAAVPLGGLFAFWGQAHFSGLGESWSRQLSLTYLTMTTAHKGFLTAALVVLAVLPLAAACLAARRPGADDGPSGPSDRRPPSTRGMPLALVFTLSAAAAVVALALTLLTDGWWSSTLSHPVVDPSGTGLAPRLTAFAVLQGLVALAVATVAGRRGTGLGWVSGFAAAVLAGVLVTGVVAGDNLVRRSVPDGGVPWGEFRNACVWLLGQGALVALPVALVGAALGRCTALVRRGDPAGTVPAAGNPAHPGRSWRVARVVQLPAVLMVLILGVAAVGAPPQLPENELPVDRSDRLALPPDLGAASLCAWLPPDEVWLFKTVPAARTKKEGGNADLVGRLTWYGSVLTHADDPELARLGRAVVDSTRAPDPAGATDAFTALGNYCLTLDPEAPHPAGTPVDRAPDGCLPGRWRLTRSTEHLNLSSFGLGVVDVTGASSFTVTIAPDGTAVDDSPSLAMSGRAPDGSTVTMLESRHATYRWTAGLGVFLSNGQTAEGVLTIRQGDREIHREPLRANPENRGDPYTCSSTTLRFDYVDGVFEEFTRVD
ncbi:M48 family metalloprotease [Kitasatospora sp. A2-31]|uniref:M48 family metalloprotease n=1 Tax=Kitasatospora sp. A2-31 TaxID=2916414 RepID=UPI001EE9E865|nr:M48 family metalloprotease [Kitasatospora sp. A2-31]MCG6494354.1 hypothetical protein [Kitasatospora sp. A2-31]